jgi:hypothetical protein
LTHTRQRRGMAPVTSEALRSLIVWRSQPEPLALWLSIISRLRPNLFVWLVIHESHVNEPHPINRLLELFTPNYRAKFRARGTVFEPLREVRSNSRRHRWSFLSIYCFVSLLTAPIILPQGLSCLFLNNLDFTDPEHQLQWWA